MSLREIREELIELVQSNLSVLLNPVAIADVGGELEETAGALQALGICNLLLYADTDRFYENLVRSGHTRLYFLRKSREEGNLTDYQLAISRWDSFLDAVAAGHFVLAREIVTLSGETWVSTGEYEDDFLNRLFLHRFISPPRPDREQQLRDPLTRWRTWLEAKASPRVDCCEALLARDSAAFAKAFEALIAARQMQTARESKTTLAADITFEPRSHVFVEGLAYLRLASAVGFTLEPEYPLCPSVARMPAGKPYPADMFPEIELERARGLS